MAQTMHQSEQLVRDCPHTRTRSDDPAPTSDEIRRQMG